MSGNFRLQNITSTFATAYAFDFSGLDLESGNSVSLRRTIQDQWSERRNRRSDGRERWRVAFGGADDSTGNDYAGPDELQQFRPRNDDVDHHGEQPDAQPHVMFFTWWMPAHMILVENDSVAATTGSAIAQTNVPTTVGRVPGQFRLRGGRRSVQHEPVWAVGARRKIYCRCQWGANQSSAGRRFHRRRQYLSEERRIHQCCLTIDPRAREEARLILRT